MDAHDPALRLAADAVTVGIVAFWLTPAIIAVMRRGQRWGWAVLLALVGLWPVAMWIAVKGRRGGPPYPRNVPPPAEPAQFVKPPPLPPVDPDSPDPRRAWLS